MHEEKRGAMNSILVGFIGLLLLSGICSAADEAKRDGDTDTLNYSIGYRLGEQLRTQAVEFKSDILAMGIQDAFNKQEPKFTREQMNAALAKLNKNVPPELKPIEMITSAEYRKASTDFLAENAKREGVKVLSNGVQYKVITSGSGKKPTLKDDIKVHYRILRVDGKELGSTYVGGKPRTSPMGKLVPGLQEVLQMMPEGSKWQIVLPTGTAAGGRDPLDDTGALIYEMELLSVIAVQ
jgi:FKBP-type peptidyl-prolyl cis-trans isomerase FklB